MSAVPAATSVSHTWDVFPGTVEIHLLGGFRVVGPDGEQPMSGVNARLLAFLAMRRTPVERGYVASCLWIDKPEHRALANLRSVLWRMPPSPNLVECRGGRLFLAPWVQVDLWGLLDSARRTLAGQAVHPRLADDSRFMAELLPGWYDDFVQLERERLRQLQLHALELAAAEHLSAGELVYALDTALVAVSLDMLRESAHRLVIEVHLREGNISEAVRQYRTLERVLRRELGIDPSSEITSLVERRAGVGVHMKGSAPSGGWGLG